MEGISLIHNNEYKVSSLLTSTIDDIELLLGILEIFYIAERILGVLSFLVCYNWGGLLYLTYNWELINVLFTCESFENYLSCFVCAIFNIHIHICVCVCARALMKPDLQCEPWESKQNNKSCPQIIKLLYIILKLCSFVNYYNHLY